MILTALLLLAAAALCLLFKLTTAAREHRAALHAANKLLQLETLRREASEQALLRSEEQLQAIVSMMPVPLFVKDPDSRIVMMNEACEQIFGVAFGKLEGTRGSAYFPAEQMEAFLTADRKAFEAGVLVTGEEWLWNSDLKENRRVHTFKKPLFDEHGQASLLIGMCVDVTERQRTEVALQHSLRQLRELRDHQETVREEERHRIAQGIHDQLGQNLMALKLDVAMLHGRTCGSHPLLHGEAGRVLATLDATIQSVRAIINELHPSTLELGLPAAVEWLLKQMERRSGMHCQLHLIDDSAHTTLMQRETWAIFRIVQELLSNIAEHANASRLDVSLDLRREALLIVVSDNGIGRRQEAGGRCAAFGMLAVRERIAAFGGQLAVDAQPGRGTTLSVMLPGLSQREEARSLQQPALPR